MDLNYPEAAKCNGFEVVDCYRIFYLKICLSNDSEEKLSQYDYLIKIFVWGSESEGHLVMCLIQMHWMLVSMTANKRQEI